MFRSERDKNIFEFICGPNNAVIIRTTAPGEEPKIVDLEGRFPRRLYDRFRESINLKSTVYGSVTLRLPSERIPSSLMVYPQDDRKGERWVRVFWYEPNGPTTKFEINFRVAEVQKLLQYMDENMTC